MSARRLLVIDDEPAFGAFVRRVGEGLGYEVEVTAHAREFMEAYARLAPMLIVLDVIMPETDGLELIQWLARQGCTARIIVVSGFSPEYIDAAKSLGEVRGLLPIVTLTKPIALAALRAALTAPA